MADHEAMIRRYFDALECFDVDEVLECFTPDALYSHPPYRTEGPGAPRHESRGLDELRALMERRGKRSVIHDIDVVASNGDEAFAGGWIRDGDEVVGSWVSRIRFAPDGRMSRYVAYASVPAAARE